MNQYIENDGFLHMYLREIGKTKLLTRAEEEELACRISEGDDVALDMLVKANLRFVVSVAKEFQNQGLSLGDLISEGDIGLMKAARRFEAPKGFKFITYAVWWIRQTILEALEKKVRLIVIPQNKLAELRRIRRDKRRSEMTQGNEGEEAIPLTELPEWATTPVSLDAPVGEYGHLIDILVDQKSPLPDEASMEDALRQDISGAMASLTPREREILVLYFGLDSDRTYNLSEIGARYGLSRERIRQIKEKAIAKLRHSSWGLRLASYAE